jgi:hypothetical protein
LWDGEGEHRFVVESMRVKKIAMHRSHGERVREWKQENERRSMQS